MWEVEFGVSLYLVQVLDLPLYFCDFERATHPSSLGLSVHFRTEWFQLPLLRSLPMV